MIEISSRAQAIIEGIFNRWSGFRLPGENGASAFQNWFYQLRNYVFSLDFDDGDYGTVKSFDMDYWGNIEYVRYYTEEGCYTRILNFNFNYKAIFNWITSFSYPPRPRKISSSKTINSYSFVSPERATVLNNNSKVYAVQSDTNLYSLADKNKNLVIDKWFNSLAFPINLTIGNLQIIGHGTISRIPYYIDSNLKLHHGAEIAQMQRQKMEGRQYSKSIIRLNESQFRKMLVECIQEILYESCKKRKLGIFTVVMGDNQPHSIKGLEKYDDMLYDIAMYDSPENTYCVYSVGKDSTKFVCCKLQYDKIYGTWLGFTPLRNAEVPKIIKNDLKEIIINQQV